MRIIQFNKQSYFSKIVITIGLIIGVSLSASCQKKPENKKEIQVVLLAGQSNMAGHGDYDKLDESIKQRIAKVSKRVFLSTSNNPKKKPIPLSYYKGKKGKYDFDKRFGPELFIGLKLAETYPEKEFLLIKKAVGGTSLYGAWNTDWSKEKSELAERGEVRKNLKLFSGHIQNIKRHLEQFEKEKANYNIMGLFWLQGESDSNKAVTASHYKSNLEKLISGYRTELSINNLPVVLGQVNMLPRKYKDGPSIIRKAIETVSSADEYVGIVKTSTNPNWEDYPKHSDDLHYNYEGQKRFGIAFVDAFLKLNRK